MPGPLYRPGLRKRSWGGAWVGQPVGGRPLPAVEIPYEWIATPVLRRPTNVINSAAIQQNDAATAYSSDAASIKRYGVGPASATLDTAVDADASNLATHLTTYYATPRPRQPVLAFHLLARTEDECALLLGVGLGRRVRIIHTPTSWPVGAANFIVEGVRHTLAVDQRIIEWSTAALVGVSPIVQDTFTRIVAGDWGSADITGQVWSRAGGVGADFFVSGGVGNHLHSAAGTFKESYVDTRATDWDFSVDLSWPVATASGASITRWICGRYTDSNNYYVCRLDLNTAGVVSMQIGQRVAGSFTTLASSTTVDATYAANSVYRVRFTGVTGTSGTLTMGGRAWLPAIESDPVTPLLTYQATAPALTSGTNVAVLDRAEAGNTNVPITLAWDNVAAYTGGNPQGIPGPWFRWDTSTWDGNDLRPF